VHITLAPTKVAYRIYAATKRCQAILPDLLTLPNLAPDVLDRLVDIADALVEADGKYGAVESPPDLTSLIDEAKKLRDLLVLEVRTQVARGLLDARSLKLTNRKHGTKNITTTIFHLATLLERHAEAIGDKAGFSKLELLRAFDFAENVILEVARRNFGPAKDKKKAATRIRQQAYALCIGAYDDLRRAVVYSRWKQRDFDYFAPSLHADKKSRSRKAAKSTDPSVDPEPPEKPTEESVNGKTA
jgi:hypothetical protein